MKAPLWYNGRFQSKIPVLNNLFVRGTEEIDAPHASGWISDSMDTSERGGCVAAMLVFDDRND